jgi:ABC-type molybdate transport system substrate-binding protein
VKLQAIAIPAELNVETSYQIAVLNNAPQFHLALEFLDYALSDEGKQLIRRWGFTEIETH